MRGKRILIYEEGFRGRNGKKLSEHGLQAILKNPFYYSWFKWGGKLWKGNYQPLIPKDLFDRVQKALEEKNTSKWKGHWYAFKGLLRCGYCGCVITAETIKGKYTYYRCTYGKGYCKQRIWREEKIDAMFAGALGKFYINDEIIKWTKEALIQSHEDEEKESKAWLLRLKKQLTRNETYLHKIYQDRLKGVITEDFFKAEFNEKQKIQAYILSEMEKQKNINLNYMEEGMLMLELMRDIRSTYQKADLKQKSKLLKILLNKCELKDKET